VCAVIQLSWNLKNVGKAVEITLLSITEAATRLQDKLWGCQLVLCEIKETLNIQRS